MTSPITGPIATAAAVALAVALGASAAAWQAQRTLYEARIVELNQAAERTQATLRTRLASCHAADEARRVEATIAEGQTPEGAKRLLEQQPEGIDACARMESADRAVLSNLKR